MFNNAATIISKDFILARVSEEDIFKKYLGLEPTETGSFVNPLRSGDTHPGCGFYVNDRGTWKFKDHAAGFNWDCFNIVEYEFGLTFKEALIKVAIDFNLIEGDSTQKYNYIKHRARKVPTQIRIKRRSWTKVDYQFWSKYYITPERLEFFQVVPIQQAWFLEYNILRPIYFYKETDPCYCYWFDGYEYKLYFPLRDKGKFLHVNSNIVQGFKQLPEQGSNFLYTKSFKDVMSIDVIGREFDLYSVAPMSETMVIDKKYHTEIYNRFDNIGLNFDFDRTGIRLTRKYQDTFGIEPNQCFFFGKQFRGNTFGKAKIKDFSDYLALMGIDKARKLIETILKEYNYGRGYTKTDTTF